MTRIGDVDEQGYTVGYVEDGVGWVDLQERDCSITAGRWDEAYTAHLRGQRRRPSMWAFAVRYCRSPRSWKAAVAECRDAARWRHLFEERLRDG